MNVIEHIGKLAMIVPCSCSCQTDRARESGNNHEGASAGTHGQVSKCAGHHSAIAFEPCVLSALEAIEVSLHANQ